jgi:hypothetical protein
MADELAYFRWGVNSAGHEWINARSLSPGLPATRFICEKSPVDVREYDPLQLRALFRTFALQTEITEHGILEFANRYGLLGLAEMPLPPKKAPSPLRTGETFGSWANEIAAIRRLIHIWEAAKNGAETELSKTIAWREDGVYFINRGSTLPSSPPEMECFAGRYLREELLTVLRPGDFLGPARWFVQVSINRQLDKYHVRPSLLWDSAYKRLDLNLVPRDLAGCLWLQFARAVEGDKDYRQCAHCRGWFEVGGSRAARADKKFCSPTCKASAHRAKHEEALRLFSAALPVTEIARRLGTDLNTVKGWVKK